MGLFSWQCKKCDHSIKSPYNLPTGWEYMNECVLLEPDGAIIMGEYDGYGRIGPEEREVNWESGEPEMWHKKCWENEGKPQYSGESDSAEDQGFFYNDPSEEELLDAIRATE